MSRFDGDSTRNPGMITAECPGCRQWLTLPAHLAGKRAKCPTCGVIFAMAAPGGSAAPVPTGVLLEPGGPAPAPYPRRPPRRQPRPAPGSHTGLILVMLATMFGIVAVVAVVYIALLRNNLEKIAEADADENVWKAEIPARPPGGAAPRGNPMLDGVALDPQILEKVKRATVFIRADAGGEGGTGSGFVVRRSEGSAWIVTNNHVIDPQPEGPGRPDWGGRGPLMPFPFRQRQRTVRLSAVLHSGAPNERAYPATLLAKSAEPDLALLRIDGAKDLPEPLDVKPPELRETERVYFFGFPFGQALGVGNANPAVTVSQGTISSLRRDGRGKLRAVQVECDLNPGNSGGPAINAKGQLVGIAVAIVRGTNIGLLIHPNELAAVLKTRFDAAAVSIAAQNGKTELIARASLADPEGKIKQAYVLYRTGPETGPMPAREGDGNWLPLQDAAKLPLRERGAEAVGVVGLFDFAPNHVVVVQTCYLDSAGVTHRTEPVVLRPKEPGAPKAPDAAQGESAAPPAAAKPRIGSDEENRHVRGLGFKLPARTVGEIASPKELPGLVGYWPLEEGEGDAAKDASGHGRDAKLQGHGWSKGVVGKCVELDGAQSGVDFRAGKALRFAEKEPFTFACWVKTNARDGTILALRKKEDGRPVISLRLEGRGWLVAEMRDDQGDEGRRAVEFRGPIVGDGQWRHLALARLPSGNFELYVEGQLAGRGVHTPFGAGYLNTCFGPITTDAQTWGVDRHQLKHPSPFNRSNHLAGKLDECCVFSRALTADEIKKLAGTQ